MGYYKNKYVTKFADCAGVAYSTLMSCDRGYTGQTARCVNGRARGNKCSLLSVRSDALAVHCFTCDCRPDPVTLLILAKLSSRGPGELTEVFCISEAVDTTVGASASFFSEGEVC